MTLSMNIHGKRVWREEPAYCIGEAAPARAPAAAAAPPAAVATPPATVASPGDTAAAGGEVARKLATVVAIDSVEDHPDAHSLAVATVRGWKVVTNKERDGYRAGDVAVYVEIDTVMPEALLVGLAEHAILAKKNFTVKTAKIRGVISQGILFKPSIVKGRDVAVGEDVTALLGLKKKEYAPVGSGAADLIKPFPNFVPKTDEERIQNLPAEALADLAGVELYASEKVDGSSTTIYTKGGVYHVASRNWVVGPRSPFHQAAADLGIEDKLRTANLTDIALQGELLGPSYQGNRYKLKANTILFFSVYDIAAAQYVPFRDAKALVESLGLQWVPVVHPTLSLTDTTAAALLALAEGKSVLSKHTEREGLVVRAVDEAAHPLLKRVSFKCISNKYLLKYES